MFPFVWPGVPVGKPKNPRPAKKGEMKCDECLGKMTVLATTAVCDFCNPPKGYRVGTDGKLYKLDVIALPPPPDHIGKVKK